MCILNVNTNISSDWKVGAYSVSTRGKPDPNPPGKLSPVNLSRTRTPDNFPLSISLLTLRPFGANFGDKNFGGTGPPENFPPGHLQRKKTEDNFGRTGTPDNLTPPLTTSRRKYAAKSESIIGDHIGGATCFVLKTSRTEGRATFKKRFYNTRDPHRVHPMRVEQWQWGERAGIYCWCALAVEGFGAKRGLTCSFQRASRCSDRARLAGGAGSVDEESCAIKYQKTNRTMK